MQALKLIRNPCNGHTSLTVPRYISQQVRTGAQYVCTIEGGKIVFTPVKQFAGV